MQQLLTAACQHEVVADVHLKEFLELLQLLGLSNDGCDTRVALNRAMMEGIQHLQQEVDTRCSSIGVYGVGYGHHTQQPRGGCSCGCVPVSVEAHSLPHRRV